MAPLTASSSASPVSGCSDRKLTGSSRALERPQAGGRTPNPRTDRAGLPAVANRHPEDVARCRGLDHRELSTRISTHLVRAASEFRSAETLVAAASYGAAAFA